MSLHKGHKVTKEHVKSALGWEKSFSSPNFLAREDGSVSGERHSREPSSVGARGGLVLRFYS